MIAAIQGGKLAGSIKAIASKSCAHRLLICAALSDAPCTVEIAELSADIEATAGCLNALGAKIEKIPGGYQVTPADWTSRRECRLDCNESGSTLRFLLPLAARLPEGSKIYFDGRGRLPERPNTALIGAMRLRGVRVSGEYLPLTVEGPIQSGLYEIPGNVSSQFITGLLFTLPALRGDSQIRFTTNVESGSYIALTIDALREFGITIQKASGGYDISGNQLFRSPGKIAAEGDWSNAAFFLCGATQEPLTVSGIDPSSLQPDKKILDLIKNIKYDEIAKASTKTILPIIINNFFLFFTYTTPYYKKQIYYMYIISYIIYLRTKKINSNLSFLIIG